MLVLLGNLPKNQLSLPLAIEPHAIVLMLQIKRNLNLFGDKWKQNVLPKMLKKAF